MCKGKFTAEYLPIGWLWGLNELLLFWLGRDVLSEALSPKGRMTWSKLYTGQTPSLLWASITSPIKWTITSELLAPLSWGGDRVRKRVSYKLKELKGKEINTHHTLHLARWASLTNCSANPMTHLFQFLSTSWSSHLLFFFLENTQFILKAANTVYQLFCVIFLSISDILSPLQWHHSY
jgi:hypothetical protein